MRRAARLVSLMVTAIRRKLGGSKPNVLGSPRYAGLVVGETPSHGLPDKSIPEKEADCTIDIGPVSARIVAGSKWVWCNTDGLHWIRSWTTVFQDAAGVEDGSVYTFRVSSDSLHVAQAAMLAVALEGYPEGQVRWDPERQWFISGKYYQFWTGEHGIN